MSTTEQLHVERRSLEFVVAQHGTMEQTATVFLNMVNAEIKRRG